MMKLQSHHKIWNSFMVFWILFIFLSNVYVVKSNPTKQPNAESIEDIEDGSVKTDLDKAETKDPQKLDIIKQIRKLNKDGSYTVGYEAEDGTFKIESRDVLGNVKGTFGYIDDNGEIKRVSYSANNGTGVKTTPSSVEDIIHIIPRYNRSTGAPTTRRSPLSTSSSISPTRSTVIQTIPRRLRILSPNYSSTERPYLRDLVSSTKQPPATKADPTTTVIYATSLPTTKPYINIRPTPLPNQSHKPSEQIARPDKLESHHTPKVQTSPVRDAYTSRPIIEELEEKDSERKPQRGNTLRRQLMQEAEEQYESRPQLVYSQSTGNDAGHVYSAVSGTARPLFTTTGSPRGPPVLIAARQRAAAIQNTLNAQSTTEKYYIKSPRRQDSQESDTTTEPTSDHSYLTQNPIQVQIPANRPVAQISGDERRLFRRPQTEGRFRTPQFVRVHPNPNDLPQNGARSIDSPRLVRIPLPRLPEHSNTEQQYLRETTAPTPKSEHTSEQEPIEVQIPRQYYRAPTTSITPAQTAPYVVYPQQESAAGYHQQNYPLPYQPVTFRGQPYNPNYYDNPDRPLTARDFERLLQILIIRQQQLQRYNYIQTHNNQYQGYQPYQFNGYQPYSRPPLPPYVHPYDIRPPYRTPIPVYPEPENMYQAQNPIPTTEPSMPYDLQRLIPRRKQYNPRYFGAQTNAYPMDEYTQTPGHAAPPTPNYLPSDVREELLYRMLMLALQTEPQPSIVAPGSTAIATEDTESSTTTKSPVIYKKPVRSVQILGEE